MIRILKQPPALKEASFVCRGCGAVLAATKDDGQLDQDRIGRFYVFSCPIEGCGYKTYVQAEVLETRGTINASKPTDRAALCSLCGKPWSDHLTEAEADARPYAPRNVCGSRRRYFQQKTKP